MTDDSMTPEDIEAAKMLEADIERRLEGKPITLASFKAAVLATLDAWGEEARKPAYPPIVKTERDPNDPNRIIVTIEQP